MTYVGSLRRSDRGDLGTDESKGGTDKNCDHEPQQLPGHVRRTTEKTQKSPFRSSYALVLYKSARFVPESKADALVVRAAASGDDDTGDDEPDYSDDLDGAEPELGLAIHAGPAEVNGPLR